MIIYHYSKNKIPGKLKKSFYGTNSYTKNDFNCTDIKRIFFYTEKNPEYLLSNCKYLYTVKIADHKIYDLKSDIVGYKTKYKSISEILKAIIKKGYIGIKYNIGYDIINLFQDIGYIKKEVLK